VLREIGPEVKAYSEWVLATCTMHLEIRAIRAYFHLTTISGGHFWGLNGSTRTFHLKSRKTPRGERDGRYPGLVEFLSIVVGNASPADNQKSRRG